ncbi:neurofilament medium polypeptide-like [Astyanax mexicanus]|uniref:Neurofilament medium polypeptide-like n=1 Tax=Astyanax mexicanus TaxID=7994 RepID=A0A8T2M4Y7_ASTMX|nr:neurofilament medium polypeptide-like [Astyanax mexicanus]
MVDYTKDLSPHKKAAVHRSMCHAKAVASKFYVPLNTAAKATSVRGLQESGTETSLESQGSEPDISSPEKTPKKGCKSWRPVLLQRKNKKTIQKRKSWKERTRLRKKRKRRKKKGAPARREGG